MRRHKERSKRGQLLMELGASLPIIIVVMAIGFNSVFGIMAWLTLDGACIDAARAASVAPTLIIAQKRADLAVLSHRQGGLNPTVQMMEYHNEDGDYTKDPYLVIRANVDFKLPFPALSFGDKIELPQVLHLSRVYAYPILTVDRTQDQSQPAAGRPKVAMIAIDRTGIRAVTSGPIIRPPFHGAPDEQAEPLHAISPSI